YLISQGIQTDIQELKAAMASAMEKNEELLAVLFDYFTHHHITFFSAADFTSDITTLENTLRNVLPTHLELLDLSPDYVVLTTFVRDIKDIRQILLQLVTSLPAAQTQSQRGAI